MLGARCLVLGAAVSVPGSQFSVRRAASEKRERGGAADGCGPADRLDDVGDFAGAEDGVDLGDLGAKLVTVPFRETARHNQALAGAVFLVPRHLENGVDRLLFGGVDERARIDHEHVRALSVARQLVPGFLRQPQHDLGVHEILRTPEGNQANFQFTNSNLQFPIRSLIPDPRSLSYGYSRYSMRGKRNRFANVLQPADPRDRPLDPHAEPAVGHRAVAAEVEIPLEGLLRQLVLLDPLEQEIEIGQPLAAADDLAVAFRGGRFV